MRNPENNKTESPFPFWIPTFVGMTILISFSDSVLRFPFLVLRFYFMSFRLISPFAPTGDQPQAIEKLVNGIKKNLRYQTLLGVTGSGKTFTMASVIENLQRPTLVISHNKTLAAQLASEFQDFFPNNAVHYFVSYYDFYQPEAYVPQTDTYIEKETDINEEIDRLRNAATSDILLRSDVLIVASVSCIYGLGNPTTYADLKLELAAGKRIKRDMLLRELVTLQYTRNDLELRRGTFRARGDTIELVTSGEQDTALRIDLNGDRVERIVLRHLLTGEEIGKDTREATIFPAKHFVTPKESITGAIDAIQTELAERLAYFRERGKLLEAQRLAQRVQFDLEMLLATGYVNGIENYSRHLEGRAPGSPPFTLIDYFRYAYGDSWSLFIDESHMTLPQIRGMYEGDRSRKQTLVNYGFRLPSALDNRPLTFSEFLSRVPQMIFVSATPGAYEAKESQAVVEQLVRPTGLLDPEIEIRSTNNQIDNLLQEIRGRINRHERVLVTTLTKRMAEELAEYLEERGVKVHYLHSEIDTFERLEILRDLRLGRYDVVVGINLLREGLDLPEVSLVAILDADKEGYLRSTTSLLQLAGRAARHVNGSVIMYADAMTESMRIACAETKRRRTYQETYNQTHGIVPQGIRKEIKDSRLAGSKTPVAVAEQTIDLKKLGRREVQMLLAELEEKMDFEARSLAFEKAASIRDQIAEIKKALRMKRHSVVLKMPKN
jgi:excinuclease ABC subunit B